MRRKNRFLWVALVFLISFVLAAVSTPQPVRAGPQAGAFFSDIAGSWARPYIEDLKQFDAISGFADGTFRPDDYATRGQVAKMLDCLMRGYDPTRQKAEPSPAPPSENLTPAEIAERFGPAVAYITTADSSGRPLARGSGFVVGGRKVVTNFHVIKDAWSVSLTVGGRSYRVTSLANYDEKRDIAVIDLPENVPVSAELGDSSAVRAGDSIVVIGNPLGLQNTVSTGVVSYPERLVNGLSWLQISAPVAPGSSGGPVFNLHGQVIGMVTWGYTPEPSAQNLNFAVPANSVKPMLTTSRPVELSALFPAAPPVSYSGFAGYVEDTYRYTAVGPYTLSFYRASVLELSDGTIAVDLALNLNQSLELLNAVNTGYKTRIENWLLSIYYEAKAAFPGRNVVVSATLVDYFYTYPTFIPPDCLSLQPDGTWFAIYPVAIAGNFGGYPQVVWFPVG